MQVVSSNQCQVSKPFFLGWNVFDIFNPQLSPPQKKAETSVLKSVVCLRCQYQRQKRAQLPRILFGPSFFSVFCVAANYYSISICRNHEW